MLGNKLVKSIYYFITEATRLTGYKIDKQILTTRQDETKINNLKSEMSRKKIRIKNLGVIKITSVISLQGQG